MNYTSQTLAFFCILFVASCASAPKGNPSTLPPSPDYAQLSSWAAHPEKEDLADRIPSSKELATTKDKEADVFFVHPTTYTGKPLNNQWNASITDQKLNQSTDKGTIQYQASIFNEAGRVFAPRYRQAHLNVFYTDNKKLSQQVLDQAYVDVKNAFLHYLKFYNNGRPFIIASHSQGTVHSARLIKELIDGQTLEYQMVAAYLVGMPIGEKIFETIEPCNGADDVRCFVSWRTFKKGYLPSNIPLGDSIVVHNPLSWDRSDTFVGKEKNQGAILRNFDKILKQATDAQVKNGILWAAKPKFAFSFLFTRKNYHIADLNFYYMNVKANAVERVKKFRRFKGASE